jgi:hypothetical protein
MSLDPINGVVPWQRFNTAPPSQPTTSSLALGWDFSGSESTVTVTGAGISTVTDASGNSNSGTQSTDSRRMTYGVLTINGKLAASTAADATKHIIVPATVTGWTGNGQPPFHILCCFVVNTWANAKQVFTFQTGGGSVRTGLRLSTSGGNRIEGRTPTATPGANVTLSTQTALATATAYLAELSVDGGGAAKLIVNEGTAATATSASSGESLTVRRLGDLSAAADMLVGCVYVFNTALSDSDLALWRQFIKVRWGYVV